MSERNQLWDSTAVTARVREAFLLADAARGDTPLSTAAILVAAMRADHDASGWARIVLHSRSADQIEVAQWRDPESAPAARWHDAPMTASLTKALHVAERVAARYSLTPVPMVAVVLGLIADPAAGAARALHEGTGCAHEELVSLVNDNLDGGALEGLQLPELAEVGTVARSPSVRKATSRWARLRHDWGDHRLFALIAGLTLIGIAVDFGYGFFPVRSPFSAIMRIVLTGTCMYFGVRFLRRSGPRAVARRRREFRKRRIDQRRNVAARSSAHALAGEAVYSKSAVELLSRTPRTESDGVTTRRQVAHDLADKQAISVPPDDEAGSVLVVLNPHREASMVVVSDELANCLTQAELLTREFAMNEVEVGHVAAAIAYSVFQDVDQVRAVLRCHFEEDFADLDEVLVAGGVSQNEPGDPERVPLASPGRASPGEHRQRLASLGYFGVALLLIVSLAELAVDIPARIADASDVDDALEALRSGRNDEAIGLFSRILDREPMSILAHRGRSCAVARLGDLDNWAVAENLAILVGVSYDSAGSCLAPDVSSDFHLAVLPGEAIIVVSPAPRGTHPRGPGLAIVRASGPLADLATATSCSAGRKQLPRYGAQMARYALILAQEGRADPDKVVAELRECVRGWPKGYWRDLVTRWVSGR